MSTLQYTLRELDVVPNVPFFTGPIKQKVMELALALGMIGKGIDIWHDSRGLYMRLKKGRTTTRMFLCSHLDHPGFVFNNNGFGKPLGSVGGTGNRGVLDLASLAKMDLYLPKSGRYLDTVNVAITDGGLQLGNAVKRNTVGMWHLPNRQFTGSSIRMRSADNHVATATVLETAVSLWQTAENLDLTLVFTAVEEIYQIAMTGICKGNSLGEPISANDIFFVVEAMEMKAFGGSNPSYTGGPLIKVNDGNVGYGMGAGSKTNYAELRLLNGASQLGHQHVLSGGYTDATALSLFTKCPNIATIAIPCRNKHNVDGNGNITTENVSLGDIQTAVRILQKAVAIERVRGEASLSTKVRKITVAEKSRRAMLYKHNRARMKWEFYFPENILHWIALAGSRVF